MLKDYENALEEITDKLGQRYWVKTQKTKRHKPKWKEVRLVDGEYAFFQAGLSMGIVHFQDVDDVKICHGFSGINYVCNHMVKGKIRIGTDWDNPLY